MNDVLFAYFLSSKGIQKIWYKILLKISIETRRGNFVKLCTILAALQWIMSSVSFSYSAILHVYKFDILDTIDPKD